MTSVIAWKQKKRKRRNSVRNKKVIKTTLVAAVTAESI